MRICKNCNTVFDNNYPRCAMCGEETAEFSSPTCEIATPSNTGARVMSYIGLGLGIFGLAFGTIALIMTLMLFDASEYFITEAFSEAFVLAILALGGSIAGKQLTSKAMQYGCLTGASKTGHILSTIGFAMNIASMGLATFAVILMSVAYA